MLSRKGIEKLIADKQLMLKFIEIMGYKAKVYRAKRWKEAMQAVIDAQSL